MSSNRASHKIFYVICLSKSHHGRGNIWYRSPTLDSARSREVLLLDDSHASERGTHDSMLEENGAYARLWNFRSAISMP